jgi:hypothetical protein
MFGRIQANHWRLCFFCADASDTSDVLVEHSMSTVLAVGGKHFRSFRHHDNVLVARYRPEPTAVVFGIPSDGRFVPEPRENLMWYAIAVEIRILEIDEGGFHRYTPLERPPIFAGIPFWSLQL